MIFHITYVDVTLKMMFNNCGLILLLFTLILTIKRLFELILIHIKYLK